MGKTSGNEAPAPESAADAAVRELIETRKPVTGVKAALERFRQIDEDAQVIWKTTGPRRSSTAEFAGILVDRGGELGRQVVIVQEFASGKFKLFVEANPDIMDVAAD